MIECRLPYLLLPPTSQGHPVIDENRHPLILFLHGGGERGTDLDAIQQVGLIPNRIRFSNFPFFILAPQCPLNDWWASFQDSLIDLLDSVITNHPVDSKRIYLTGLSLGGMGTWHLAVRHPHRFAAIVPVCGFGYVWYSSPKRIPLLKDIPTWVFHGEDDRVVPVEESINMVSRLREAGSNARLTLYPNTGHDAWDQAYSDPELYRWLLQHTTDTYRPPVCHNE